MRSSNGTAAGSGNPAERRYADEGQGIPKNIATKDELGCYHANHPHDGSARVRLTPRVARTGRPWRWRSRSRPLV